MTGGGRVSLGAALIGWAALVVAMLFGGLDPSPSQAPLLKAASVAAFCVSAVALGLGVVALVRGQQRVAAAFGLGFSLIFLLLFTGLGFAVFR
jgi:hypothetical protein